MEKYAIIVAGGKGTRMKSEVPKQFLPLLGKPIMAHTINKFLAAECKVIIVLPKDHFETFEELVLPSCHSQNIKFTEGGITRFHSVKNGLELIDSDGYVAVHDAVRPLISLDTIQESFNTAQINQTAVTSIPLKDSIREIKENTNSAKDRSKYRLIQTPQTFSVTLLKKAYETEYLDNFTDDASVVEHYGATITLFNGDYSNLKITTPEDLIIAKALINEEI